MLNSVHARLTVWYAGVLTLVLLLFSAGVYMVVRRAAMTRLDSGLTSALQVISLSLQHEIDEHHGQQPGEEAFRGVLATIHQASFPRQAIGVYQGSRTVADKPADDGLHPRAVEAGKSRPLFFTMGESRAAGIELHVPNVAEPYWLTAAERLDETHAELRTLREALLLGVALAVALAGATGYLLARKSLAPVVAMSSDVDRIGSGNLSDRVEVANPRDELGRLAGTFNRLLERLQGAFDRQRQFMADASHELRTPISVALAAAQVNLSGGERPAGEYREALDIIHKQMARLTRLVNDLFLLAKADTGAAQLHRRRFSLDETVRESAAAARVLANGKGLTVSLEDLPECPFEGDPDMIRQLLLLLLDNAIKYTPTGGQVQVGLRGGNAHYEVTVADTGAGIPAEAQSLIFERFYRVDKARSRSANSLTGGAGLGLPIGRWIAEAHGGSLTLERSGPGGSLFCARFPVR